MCSPYRLLPFPLLASLFLIEPPATWAQTTGSDSIRPAADTSRPTTAPRAAADTATRPAVIGTAGPVDSILSAACRGSPGPTSTARDLLVVVFVPGAGGADRAGVAKGVKGKVLGPVVSEPGAYYLWTPTDGEEHRLRAAADRLIRSDLVREVGSRSCPSVPPVDTAPPQPPTPQPPGS